MRRAKFGHPASLIREYRIWLVSRGHSNDPGRLVLVCGDAARAFSQSRSRVRELAQVTADWMRADALLQAGQAELSDADDG